MRLSRIRLTKHLLDFVNDEDFDPGYYGPGSGRDEKPKPHVYASNGGHKQTQSVDELRKALRCMVDGCGVDWAPQGVCGYCRNRVRELRAERACRATRKAG
jgi:hypothetical protein